MRYKVFVDTNILLSGIFFDGNESRILDLVELDFVTSEDVVLDKILLSYGLAFHLPLLPTPPCGVPKAFGIGYRSESVCLKGTSTPLTLHTLRHTMSRSAC